MLVWQSRSRAGQLSIGRVRGGCGLRSSRPALARRYGRTVYPHLASDYRSAECRPGGAYDEGLPDPPWS